MFEHLSNSECPLQKKSLVKLCFKALSQESIYGPNARGSSTRPWGTSQIKYWSKELMEINLSQKK